MLTPFQSLTRIVRLMDKRTRSFIVALVSSAWPLCAAPAFAEGRTPAPVTFAALTEPQATAALPGGGADSYAYPPQTHRGAPGAVLDLRRQNPERQPGPMNLTLSADNQTGQGAPHQPHNAAQPAAYPQWLERERVGAPYQANGRTYVPTAEPGYQQTGVASWYGPQFHGKPTASGEVFDQDAITAAHPTLPIPSLVQVTNLATGRDIIVRVNDRGPFIGDRIIDLSRGAAHALDIENQGQAQVHLRYLGPAPVRFGATPTAVVNAPAPQPEAQPFRVANAPSPNSSANAGPYLVQVGAFSQSDNAQAAAARLAGLGEVLIETRAGDALYRVRVGGWLNENDAQAAKTEIAARGFPGAIVTMR